MPLVTATTPVAERNALPHDAWKQRLREKATIRRGTEVISFFVGGHKYSGKHRTSVYKYPESNKVSYQRIGDDSTTITLPGWIVSEDIQIAVNGSTTPIQPYQDVRDRLITLLQKGGLTTLEHPYLGTMLFFIDSFDVSEEVGTFAYADVSIQGFRVDKRNFRQEYSATEASDRVQEFVTTFNRTVRASVDNGIYELQKVGGDPNQAPPVPGWIQKVDQLIEDIDNVAAQIEQVVVSPIKRAQRFLQGTTDRIKKIRKTGQRLYSVKKELGRITALSIGIFYDSVKLADTVVGALTPGFNPFGYSPFGPVEQKRMIQEYAIHIPQSIMSSAFELSFEGVINRLVLSQCAIIACSLASNSTYQSQQDVDDTREAIVRLTDAYLSFDEITYEEREALMGLKAATIESLYAVTTIQTRKVTPTSPITLIQLMYQEEGGLGSMESVAVRNNIVDPMAIETEVVL